MRGSVKVKKSKEGHSVSARNSALQALPSPTDGWRAHLAKKPALRNSTKLPRSFYLRPTVQVARDLLGKYLVRRYRGKSLAGKIVEAEAYCEGDPASHSYRGKTKRNELMFRGGGHLYVYFTYGMHFCANVVTRKEGVGEAVLVRAVEPINGLEVMMKMRFSRHQSTTHQSPLNITNGPAKFCEAFGIAREQNGTDLLGNEIYILKGEKISLSRIGRSARIGVTNGREKKRRFFVKGNPWVSK
jgi:DNA-3-methyladenine glycosylase